MMPSSEIDSPGGNEPDETENLRAAEILTAPAVRRVAK